MLLNEPFQNTNMYFVAILCPPPADEKVLRFKLWMKDRFGCVAALKSSAHITLIPPFWMEEAKETELQQTLQSFTSNVQELEIQLNGFSHFGKKVLFVNVKENSALEEFKKQTEIHFIQSYSDIIKKDDRPFHPHITIANRDLKPGDFEKAWEHFSKKNFNATFITRTISLLKLSTGKWNVIVSTQWG